MRDVMDYSLKLLESQEPYQLIDRSTFAYKQSLALDSLKNTDL